MSFKSTDVFSHFSHWASLSVCVCNGPQCWGDKQVICYASFHWHLLKTDILRVKPADTGSVRPPLAESDANMNNSVLYKITQRKKYNMEQEKKHYKSSRWLIKLQHGHHLNFSRFPLHVNKHGHSFLLSRVLCVHGGLLREKRCWCNNYTEGQESLLGKFLWHFQLTPDW